MDYYLEPLLWILAYLLIAHLSRLRILGSPYEATAAAALVEAAVVVAIVFPIIFVLEVTAILE